MSTAQAAAAAEGKEEVVTTQSTPPGPAAEGEDEAVPAQSVPPERNNVPKGLQMKKKNLTCIKIS